MAESPRTVSRAPPNRACCVKTLALARNRTAPDCLAVAWASTAELCPKTRAKSCSSHDHSIASNRRHDELRSTGRPAGSRGSHAMTPTAVFLVPPRQRTAITRYAAWQPHPPEIVPVTVTGGIRSQAARRAQPSAPCQVIRSGSDDLRHWTDLMRSSIRPRNRSCLPDRENERTQRCGRRARSSSARPTGPLPRRAH